MDVCDLVIPDNMLSKIHAVLKLVDGRWLLQDGDGVFPSTNGTWFYINEDFGVYDGLVFKANMTLFEATLN